ncbi:TPA: hypothetical protein ACTPQ1_004541, partial [Salmonella enterica]
RGEYNLLPKEQLMKFGPPPIDEVDLSENAVVLKKPTGTGPQWRTVIRTQGKKNEIVGYIKLARESNK